ncbi:hypothetical protein OQY15_18220 [Pedobacter sp. MC2016-15]|uniref:hypothetical protein n=1 Tax=Pedobacter sp. MC2016-15 TaxID=2994473 RepID=UPI0022471013|nr:hypothetical protein [Pedobacter sp. MC2016-15]MCX2481046.1 hypothetical protein [Pedobacter sp. MC2016-15]
MAKNSQQSKNQSTKSQSINPSQILSNSEDMTVINENTEVLIESNLEQRNVKVEEAYHSIVKQTRELLTAFDSLKYRMSVSVDHANSGKPTNLINEWLSSFHNFTLTRNRFGYSMIYVSYDEDSLTRFGDKIFNRMLRIVFNTTNTIVGELNIENCIRIDHCATDIQPFFINRLFSQEHDYVTIHTEEKVPS